MGNERGFVLLWSEIAHYTDQTMRMLTKVKNNGFNTVLLRVPFGVITGKNSPSTLVDPEMQHLDRVINHCQQIGLDVIFAGHIGAGGRTDEPSPYEGWVYPDLILWDSGWETWFNHFLDTWENIIARYDSGSRVKAYEPIYFPYHGRDKGGSWRQRPEKHDRYELEQTPTIADRFKSLTSKPLWWTTVTEGSGHHPLIKQINDSERWQDAISDSGRYNPDYGGVPDRILKPSDLGLPSNTTYCYTGHRPTNVSWGRPMHGMGMSWTPTKNELEVQRLQYEPALKFAKKYNVKLCNTEMGMTYYDATIPVEVWRIKGFRSKLSVQPGGMLFHRLWHPSSGGSAFNNDETPNVFFEIMKEFPAGPNGNGGNGEHPTMEQFLALQGQVDIIDEKLEQIAKILAS